jgi:hypothetical protein
VGCVASWSHIPQLLGRPLHTDRTSLKCEVTSIRTGADPNLVYIACERYEIPFSQKDIFFSFFFLLFVFFAKSRRRKKNFILTFVVTITEGVLLSNCLFMMSDKRISIQYKFDFPQFSSAFVYFSGPKNDWSQLLWSHYIRYRILNFHSSVVILIWLEVPKNPGDLILASGTVNQPTDSTTLIWDNRKQTPLHSVPPLWMVPTGTWLVIYVPICLFAHMLNLLEIMFTSLIWIMALQVPRYFRLIQTVFFYDFYFVCFVIYFISSIGWFRDWKVE